MRLIFFGKCDRDTGTGSSNDTSGGQSDSSRNVSPPRAQCTGTNSSSNSSSQRDWSEENVGKVLYDSLKILDLGYRYSIAEVKAQY